MKFIKDHIEIIIIAVAALAVFTYMKVKKMNETEENPTE